MTTKEEYVMIARGYANGSPSPHDGQYLEYIDIEADMPGGFTSDIDKALRFPSAKEAFEAWRTVRKKSSPRFDGQPDRPFTAFNVEFRRIDDGKA